MIFLDLTTWTIKLWREWESFQNLFSFFFQIIFIYTILYNSKCTSKIFIVGIEILLTNSWRSTKPAAKKQSFRSKSAVANTIQGLYFLKSCIVHMGPLRVNKFVLFIKKVRFVRRHLMSIKFNPNQFIKNRLCIIRKCLWYIWGGNSNGEKMFWENIFFYENCDIWNQLIL